MHSVLQAHKNHEMDYGGVTCVRGCTSRSATCSRLQLLGTWRAISFSAESDTPSAEPGDGNIALWLESRELHAQPAACSD